MNPARCEHCQGGFLDNRFGQDVECVNGVLIDIDVYHEGPQTDLCYPVAPCHPDYAKQCADEDWCSDLSDVQGRLGSGQILADATPQPLLTAMTDAELEELKAGMVGTIAGLVSDNAEAALVDKAVADRDGEWASAVQYLEDRCGEATRETGNLRQGICEAIGLSWIGPVGGCQRLPDDVDIIAACRAVIARLQAAESALRRISRWERYGGEDSVPIVCPKDIALAYFAPLPAPPSKREEA